MDGSENGGQNGSAHDPAGELMTACARLAALTGQLNAAADRVVGPLVDDARENADRRADFWKKTSDHNEVRWRDLATRWIRERNLRHDIQHAARAALAVELDDECNCDQALEYRAALEYIVEAEGMKRDADLATMVSDVLRRHGERLTAAAEHWNKEADAALAELREVEAQMEDVDVTDPSGYDADVKCSALRHRYADMTGHAMAALVLGVELKGELEKVGLTVEALDELKVPAEERVNG